MTDKVEQPGNTSEAESRAQRTQVTLTPETLDFLGFQVARRALLFLAAVATIAIIPAAYFGYNLKTEINDLNKSIENTKKSYTSQLKAVETRYQTTLDQMEERFSGNLREAQELQKNVNDMLTRVQNQSADLYRTTGRLEAVETNTQRAREELQKEVDNATKTFEGKAGTFESERKTEFTGFNSRITDKEGEINDRIQKSRDFESELDNNLRIALAKVAQLDEAVQGAGTFALHEKMTEPIEIDRFQILARIAIISGKRNEISEFSVYSSAGACLLYQPRARLQSPLGFTYQNFRYTIYPNYVIEHFPGADYAVFDISRVNIPGEPADSSALGCPRLSNTP